ncbi:MAG: hypothetical protein HY010_11135 [Acidobacteria bacterium]|nr:hypothetical protein [Acidobacteriota bacterium]
MATMTETPAANSATKSAPPSHEYHADAHVLSGHLKRPIEQTIEQHAPVSLKGRRSGHLTRMADGVSIEGLVTFAKGHTRVSGSKSTKPGHGWVTLSTSVLEGLNVFEIITADRLVSQVSTEHPEEGGHFPHVTFLGTQFHNLKVSGIPLKLKLNYGICGAKPAGDNSYLDDLGFLGRVKDQTVQVLRGNGLPNDVKDSYDKRLTEIERLISNKGSNCSGKPDSPPSVICSLISEIDKNIEKEIEGVKVFGHVLYIPDFGSVSLGEVTVGERWYEPSDKKPANYFELTVINMNLGCVGTGNLKGGTAANNGHHNP